MKSLLGIGLIVIAAHTAAADPNSEGNPGLAKVLRFGGRIGMSSAKIGGAEVDDAAVKNRTGFAIGGLMTLQFHGLFAFETGLGYVQKGTGVVGSPEQDEFDYIAVPLLGVLLVPVRPSTRLRAFAGPTVSYLVNAQITGLGEPMDLKDVIKTVDIGVTLGIGVDVAVGPGLLLFDGRYEHGMTSLDSTDSNIDVKHRAFLLNAGYAL